MAGKSIGHGKGNMITDTQPPVISNETYNELLDAHRLAKKVYFARSNFSELCAALEKLYKHFEDVENGVRSF